MALCYGVFCVNVSKYNFIWEECRVNFLEQTLLPGLRSSESIGQFHVKMASDNEYALQDKLDEFLALSISTYVIFSKLSTFANDLRVPRREMDRIMVRTPISNMNVSNR